MPKAWDSQCLVERVVRKFRFDAAGGEKRVIPMLRNLAGFWRNFEKPSVIIRGRPLVCPIWMVWQGEGNNSSKIRIVAQSRDGSSGLPRGILVGRWRVGQTIGNKNGQLGRI